MEVKAAIMQNIEHLVEDVDSKKKVCNKRGEVFTQLFGKKKNKVEVKWERDKKSAR